MNKEQIKRIHLIYGILVGASTVVAGVCLINACVGIYYSGDQPYSREAVAAAFAPIAVPVYLCLALVIGGFILNLLLPAEKAKQKATKSEELTLNRLREKTDSDKWEAHIRTAIFNEQKKRRLHSLISTALLVISAVIFLIYALNGDHFHATEINSSMISAMKLMLPCLAVPFAYTVFASYYNKRSMKREIELLKEAKAAGAVKAAGTVKVAGAEKATAAEQSDGSRKEANLPCNATPESNAILADRRVFLMRCVFLTIGLALMIVGIATGGVADVLAKAINICTECIGLG